MWRFKAFASDFKRTVVYDWYLGQDESVQAAFETRLKFLKAQPLAVWQRPYVGTLSRDCKGLHEIRFKVGNVQHRPIGYFSGNQDNFEFTILAFATERDSQFDPLEICRIAKRRKAMIEQDRRYAREFTFED